MTSSYYVT